MTIILTQFGDQIKAHVKDNPGIWGVGRDSNAAIGDLLTSYPEIFQIELIYDYGKPAERIYPNP